MESGCGVIPEACLELCAVGISLIDITRLHRKIFFHSLFAHGHLDLGDKVHQLYGAGAADVIDLEGDRSFARSFASLRMTGGAFRNTGRVATRVFPSPVAISAMLPICSLLDFMIAKASGRISSKVFSISSSSSLTNLSDSVVSCSFSETGISSPSLTLISSILSQKEPRTRGVSPSKPVILPSTRR